MGHLWCYLICITFPSWAHQPTASAKVLIKGDNGSEIGPFCAAARCPGWCSGHKGALNHGTTFSWGAQEGATRIFWGIPELYMNFWASQHVGYKQLLHQYSLCYVAPYTIWWRVHRAVLCNGGLTSKYYDRCLFHFQKVDIKTWTIMMINTLQIRILLPPQPNRCENGWISFMLICCVCVLS